MVGQFTCRHLLPVTTVLLVAAGMAAARADVATQGIDAGQLTLAETTGILLDWEDLNISPDEVRVSYQFTNTGAAPVKTAAILPLAPLDFSVSLDYTLASAGKRNVMDLEVMVDGKSVRPEARAVAYLDGKDISELLARHRLPVVPFAADPERDWDAFYSMVKGLSAEARMELEEAGALSLGEPAWTALLAFVWPVSLPPEQPVEITYRYTPVPATGLFSRESLADRQIVKRYCIDRDFAAAVRKRLARGNGAGQGAVVAQYVRYMFTGVGGWAGPIGRFYLTVDKGKVDTLVSMCASGALRTGETTVRLERFDHTPDRNLEVLFIRDLDTR